jgi:2'-hydroxyisoflavone reductase
MKFLILGGTRFLGRHLINSALNDNHEVTIFTRGREKIDLNPEVEQLAGDRKNNLEALKGRTWDRVIDTSGYVPWDVESSAKLLADNIKHYTFISSMSVYSDSERPNINEATPVSTITKEELKEVKATESPDTIMEYYGALKYLCEEAAKKTMSGRVLNIRPGLIVGQYDPTNRFTYWVDRVSKGGEVLCPGRADKTVQLIHASDLAEWVIKASKNELIGEYNATGPDYNLTMEKLLEKCREVCSSNASLTWVNEDFLFDTNVQYWSHMPLWIPDRLNNPGFLAADISKALKEGLSFKPLVETILDTLSWAESQPKDYSLKAGITIEREKELLELWRKK